MSTDVVHRPEQDRFELPVGDDDIALLTYERGDGDWLSRHPEALDG